MSPYVGMARKQNGGYNASISVQTPLVHLVANCTHPKTVRSALLRCPNTTVALRLLVNVVRVTNPGADLESLKGGCTTVVTVRAARKFCVLIFIYS